MLQLYSLVKCLVFNVKCSYVTITLVDKMLNVHITNGLLQSHMSDIVRTGPEQDGQYCSINFIHLLLGYIETVMTF